MVIQIIQYNFIPMTNAELVQYLANGYTIIEIAKITHLPTTTINKKIYTLRQMLNVNNTIHLVAEYFRKDLIK